MIDMMPSRVVSIAMGVPQNGWFIGDNPTKMDDLVVPPFMETPKLRWEWKHQQIEDLTMEKRDSHKRSKPSHNRDLSMTNADNDLNED